MSFPWCFLPQSLFHFKEGIMESIGKQYALLGIIALLLCFGWTAGASAITMQVSPTTATIGETVTVTVTGQFNLLVTPPPDGSLNITFGDGSPQQTRSPLNGTPLTTYSFTATHTYNASGTYTITGWAVQGSNTVTPPLRVTQTITISDALDTALPRGEVGIEYEHRLQSLSGARNRYRVSGGRLPPGLKLQQDGQITGVPTQKGTFSFTLQILTAQGISATQQLAISVDPGRLLIETAPELLDVTVGAGASQRVTFTVVHPTIPIPETIRSARGEFVVNGRVLGTNNTPLTVNLNTARPSTTENVSIPQSVLQAAQNVGTNRISYRRTFSAQNLRSGVGEARVNLRTAAAGELRITKMRVFFEQNNRPLILVERNERTLTGVVEIHYSGSGAFKGYWKVDERIIQRVQQNLFYGTVLTLKTPPAPPLPTYSEGAHRLQFIITEPETAQQRIEFPEAIYHVEAKTAEIVTPITVTTPEDRAVLSSGGALFSWNDHARIETYHLDFFKNEEPDPFFTAYTKQGTYQLSAKVFDLKFAETDAYRWRVRGYNAAGDLAAESGEQRFTLAPDSSFVPGQVIFLVDNTPAGRELISTITTKYRLIIKEQTDLVSTMHIMVICSTEADLPQLLQELEQEDGLLLSQPNFIYNTMSEQDPLRSMQSIHRLIDLTPLQNKVGGKAVRVAVVDTGVELKHQDLEDRIVASHNLIADSPFRGEIHGTAVAGIIAGARNDFGIIGIAPEAELIVLRACEQLAANNLVGTCYSATIARALDIAITEDTDIVNLSLGSAQQDRLVSDLITRASQAGLRLVAPAGNNPQALTMAFPASHPEVIAVAGFDEANNPLPNQTVLQQADAAAPATGIFSTIPGNKHNFHDGTSFSAATISGLIALSLQNRQNDTPPPFPHFDKKTPWQLQVAAFLGLP
jgi:hypothetical protein